MAITALETSWLGYDSATGKLWFWDGAQFRPFQEAAGYLAAAGGTVSGDLGVGGAFAVEGPSDFGDAVRFAGQNKLNKAAAGDTTSWLFTNADAGRAELGLITDDNLTIQVSPDGVTWFLGLSIDKATGHVGLGGFTADANNGLGLKATNILFDNEENHLRALFNKRTAGDDASFGFETNFSARALIGLLGNDDFTFKVSPDGAAFISAFIIDHVTGATGFAKPFGILGGAEARTIAGGVLTITRGACAPQPESGAADDLDTINGGFDGCSLVLVGTASQSITVKDGTGNLKLAGDCLLDNFEDTLTLFNRGGTWLETARSNNG